MLGVCQTCRDLVEITTDFVCSRCFDKLLSKHAYPVVYNHWCEGLLEFQSYGDDVTPALGLTGEVQGNEADNPKEINYCPFCGFKLKKE